MQAAEIRIGDLRLADDPAQICWIGKARQSRRIVPGSELLALLQRYLAAYETTIGRQPDPAVTVVCRGKPGSGTGQVSWGHPIARTCSGRRADSRGDPPALPGPPGDRSFTQSCDLRSLRAPPAPEAVKPVETISVQRFCMRAACGSLIQATVGSFGGSGDPRYRVESRHTAQIRSSRSAGGARPARAPTGSTGFSCAAVGRAI
jgi:hypothetical protein